MTSECHSLHPVYLHSVVNSLESHVKSKLDHERRRLVCIKDFRRTLRAISEYNSQTLKKRPRLRNIDTLLINFIEVESEIFYLNNPNPSEERESAVQIRILRLLQQMLQHYVPAQDNQEHHDLLVKKKILDLLGKVTPTWLEEGKVLHKLAEDLVKSVKQTAVPPLPPAWEISPNFPTSDYGTDESDSDQESHTSRQDLQKATSSNTPDCVEVLLTTNGVTPVPTIEFTDKDGDSYMTYLAKNQCSLEKKRKDTDEVIICSDSEDELNHTLEHKRIRTEEKPKGVVTFEILDDDETELNYMVYLQKEVTGNSKKKEAVSRVSEEVIICSDSEDESEIKIEESHPEDMKSEERIEETIEKKDSDPQNILSLLLYENETSPAASHLVLLDITKKNHLIDPTVVFDATQMQSCGDPMLIEKEESTLLQENCFLEELFDDNFLLEGPRGEFEELDKFLFTDTSEHSFFRSDFLANEDEGMQQPEDFDKNVGSLDAILGAIKFFGNKRESEGSDG